MIGLYALRALAPRDERVGKHAGSLGCRRDAVRAITWTVLVLTHSCEGGTGAVALRLLVALGGRSVVAEYGSRSTHLQL